MAYSEQLGPYFANKSPVPQKIAEKMQLYSWKPGCPVPISDLCYLQINHFGFDERAHLGELIIHAKVAKEIMEIFQELYEKRFPINSIKLIDDYEGDDNASMADNNSSAFCFREAVAKPGIISKHSFGLAIDINPLHNPYVRGDLILPPQGKSFLDRTRPVKGMITQENACYKAFTKRGWTWGGAWEDRQDFQHFEKEPSELGLC